MEFSSRWLKDLFLIKNSGFGIRYSFSRAWTVRPLEPSRKDYIENKNEAFALVSERVKFYNKFYNFTFNKIYIKNQKTRWGSCSNKQNINLNYKIIFLPQRHQDYIIVHEMCHLKEFNHSRKFWALVERALPNYLEIKKELRNHELFYK